jgi:hypothetical protein
MACGGFITLPSLRVRLLGLSDNRIRGSGEAFLNKLARKGTALPYCVALQSDPDWKGLLQGAALGVFRVSKTSYQISQRLTWSADEAVTN